MSRCCVSQNPPPVQAHGGHDHAGHDHHHHDHKHEHQHTDGASCGHSHAARGVTVPLRASGALLNEEQTLALRIDAMDCPTEEALIRKSLGVMEGVVALEFNLMQRVLTVRHCLADSAVLVAAIADLGMQAEPMVAGARSAAPVEVRKSWWPLVAAGVAALGSEAVAWLGFATPWLSALLGVLAVLLCGVSTYKKGWVALRHRNLNINVLMSIAVTGAFAIGQWPEAAMVMVLFTLAERIEAASLDRARHAIRGLMALTPEYATVQQADGSWREQAAAEVQIGATVRLKPGERVPLDGTVRVGASAVDQAPITGESVPVEKTVGDALFAGTINQSGELEFTVTAASEGSTLARIIHAVEAAQGNRAPTQRFVDQFAKVYTPVVLLIAILVAVLPPLVWAAPWLASIYKGLVLLVIACPCALVISTPVSIVSGLAAAARHGILIKGGVYLEQGRRLRWLALDKTGTLTYGKPQQTDMLLVQDDVTQLEVRSWAASIASRSDHPVSRAIANAAAQDTVALEDVEAFTALPGRGSQALIAGRLFYLGNHRLIEELGLCSPALESKLEALESQGKTTVLLASETQVLALFAVADTVKESSRQAIAALHKMGIQTLMLSGDNPHTAQAIAQQVGIEDARGNQLPEDKLNAINALIAAGGRVGMVGDGINDAPALARADIGFAMGAAGTDTAIETADVALMDDDLRKIPQFIEISRATSRILSQNIGLALGIKAIFLALTIAGLGTMWMAVFADMGASLLVVFNGLRLLRR